MKQAWPRKNRSLGQLSEGKGVATLDSQSWITAWKEGRTNFHQGDYHDKLLEYFPQLSPEKGQSVLVPLCGKSKDLLWLHGLNLHVHGIELHDQAVESFLEENALSPLKKTQDQDFTHYAHENIVISCGDFFKLSENDTYDFIYDRASPKTDCWLAWMNPAPTQRCQ